MAFTPDELAAGQRLALYNSRKVDPQSNPYGLGQGGQRNFLTAAEDLSTFGSAVMREALSLLAETERLSGEAQVAALIIEGGPVTSVTIGGVTQTGAVTVDISDIAEDVQEQLDIVIAAQASLAAQAASGNAYSLAFGG